ncbi:MAG: cation:proton antiporter [Verrucomicrobia bacterium]|nr:cation:proton antiporter [Verrucomicrobiota bacterium]MCH8514345.1 cation:proton antiporter [Kiritimatiellia bacterium]
MNLNLIIVIILLGGWFSGRLFERIRLPSVLGMLGCGLLIGISLGERAWPPGLADMEPFLKTFALVVILLRAGLGIRRRTLNQIGGTALSLAVIPCLFEGAALTLALRFFFDFPWPVSALTAFMLAAVSPAVVVPAMLNLSEAGYGRRNAVPTLVLAGASVDDVLAITLFSLFTRMALSETVQWTRTLFELPLAILVGIVPGIAVGLGLSYWFRKRRQQVRATEKTLILLMVSLLLVQAGDWLHSAALLGIMAVGFLLLERAEPIAHELAAKLAKIWVFAEIILFVLIGMQVDPHVALQAGPLALAVVGIGLAARSVGVWLATSRSKLTRKERLFCVLAYFPKATVQAALGSVPLSLGIEGGETILALAVLSILITAPLGLLGIRFGGPRLLIAEKPKRYENA